MSCIDERGIAVVGSEQQKSLKQETHPTDLTHASGFDTEIFSTEPVSAWVGLHVF